VIPWAKEARDLAPDPVSGAKLTRLSGSSIRTENIYCDDPRATADGKRVASWRYVDHLLSPKKALLVHDLTTKWTGLIDTEVTGHAVGPAWGGSVYYPSGSTLRRASLADGKVETVFEFGRAGVPRLWQLMSIAGDESYFYYTAVVPPESSPETYNLVRAELPSGKWKLLLEETTTNRLGVALEPIGNRRLLISTTAWKGQTRYGIGLVADPFGRGARELFSEIHHGCWLADTGKFAALHSYDHENMRHTAERPDGELVIYDADSSRSKFIPTPEHLLYHISPSRCGRYVVSESLTHWMNGPTPIVVINVESGKYRTLVEDCRCSAAGDDGRQAKPYFTADSRYVIYNGDPDGVVNVFAAEIPEGFLQSLEN
jgi:hypothetical protein